MKQVGQGFIILILEIETQTEAQGPAGPCQGQL